MKCFSYIHIYIHIFKNTKIYILHKGLGTLKSYLSKMTSFCTILIHVKKGREEHRRNATEKK